MKKLVLTGAGSEQKFRHQGESWGESYFLVFNDGELRVPISAEALQTVIEHMYSADRGVEDAATPESQESDEEWQRRAKEVPYASAFGHGRNGHGDVTDEDGVDQV